MHQTPKLSYRLSRPADLSKRLNRFGVATLELVLSLPVLLVLIVGVVWLGNSVVAQTEVTIQARHNAWSKRSESVGTALLFLKDDVVSDGATQAVEVSPLFDNAGTPESAHDVMAAAWDFEKLPLDNAPNWNQYLIAAGNAKAGSLQTDYVDASNKFERFKNEANNIWDNLGADMIRQLTGLGKDANSLLLDGESSGADKKGQLRNRIEQLIERKKNALKNAQDALRKLGNDASEALEKVLKNRIKRLKSDVDDLESDLEAINE